MNGFLFVVGM